MRKLFSDALYVFTAVLPVLFLTVTASSSLLVCLCVALSLVICGGIYFAVPFLVPVRAKKAVLFVAAIAGVSCSLVLFGDLISSVSGAELYMPLCVASSLLLIAKRDTKGNALSEAVSSFRLCAIFSVITMFIGILREFLGAGRIFSLPITVNLYPPMEAFARPTGALIIAALVFALFSMFAKEGSDNA